MHPDYRPAPPHSPPAAFPWRVALALAVWLLATIGLRPLLLPDEGRYAGVAYEMSLGDGLTPTLAGLPFFHKPPLLYWLDLAGLKLLGAQTGAVRLGPAVFGWVLGMALFLHGRRWHGQAAARAALTVLATSPLFYVGAQYVNHDIGVAACITAAVLSLVRAVDDPRRTSRRWLLLGWACCGLGVLAKGLIGIVLPALVIVPWLLAQGRWRQMLSLLHPLGLLAFALVAGPWMVVMQQRYPGFFDYFIVEQHFRRYTGSTFNNRMPVWFFFAVLPLLMLPWSGWLTALRPRLWRTLGTPAAAGARGEAGAGSSPEPDGASTAPGRLGLYGWWALAIVGFFSLPESKLVGYVLPALAPVALVIGLVLQHRGTPWVRVALASGAACIAIVGILAWKAPGSHRELAQTLAARWQAGDRVAFIEAYFYDLPFLARLPSPPISVSDWDDPGIPLSDNWRKELLDASRFDAVQGARALWTWSRLPELACTDGRLWLLGSTEHLPRVQAALPGLQTVQTVRGVALLLLPGRACAPP
jgi:4-amino-4-deoxy-L-arabinose transferase-like glycosyltransferase